METLKQMLSPLPLSPAEKHRRAQHYARLTYLGIILIFLTICTVAVLTTMSNEEHKTSFRAIHVHKPISFFDYSYVDHPTSSPNHS